MKLIVSTMSLLLALAIASPASYAQVKTGVGVGMQSGMSGLYSLLITELDFSSIVTTFNVPVVAQNFRFEPEFGIWRLSSKDTDFEGKSTFLLAGAGIFGQTDVTSDTKSYFGIRTGIFYNKSTSSFSSNENSQSKTDFFIGPAIGGEHFFGDHFSLGAEARATILILGNYDSEDQTDENVISTQGVIFVRWYYN